MVNLGITRGTVNTDQSSTRPAQDDWRGSGKIVGHQSADPSELGAAPELSKGICSPSISCNPRRSYRDEAGGPGFFDIRITGDTGSAPKAAAVRPIRQTPQVRTVVDDQPRRIGSLSFGQRRAIVCRPSPAEIERRNAAMRATAEAADLRESTPVPELGEWDRALPYGSVETACALND